jgi:hypothetical protein
MFIVLFLLSAKNFPLTLSRGKKNRFSRYLSAIYAWAGRRQGHFSNFFAAFGTVVPVLPAGVPAGAGFPAQNRRAAGGIVLLGAAGRLMARKTGPSSRCLKAIEVNPRVLKRWAQAARLRQRWGWLWGMCSST